MILQVVFGNSACIIWISTKILEKKNGGFKVSWTPPIKQVRYPSYIFDHTPQTSTCSSTQPKRAQACPSLSPILVWWKMAVFKKVTTLPETNSKFAPENGWLECDPASFWGPAYLFRDELLVSRRVLLEIHLFFHRVPPMIREERVPLKISTGDESATEIWYLRCNVSRGH